MQGPVGDWAARDVATRQPTKLAMIEGLPTTTRGASEHLLGIYQHGRVRYGIAIPHLLSVLAFHSWNAKVRGLDAVSAATSSAARRRATYPLGEARVDRTGVGRRARAGKTTIAATERRDVVGAMCLLRAHRDRGYPGLDPERATRHSNPIE